MMKGIEYDKTGNQWNQETFYPEKLLHHPNLRLLCLTYEDATNNGMYLILVLSEEGTPKNGNILYVNQVTADEDGAHFENVYPTEIGEEESYIYLAGTGMEYTKLGKIVPNVEEVVPPPVTGMKGDVDVDGDVDAGDVTTLLRHVAGIESITDPVGLANGEVNNDDELTAADVTVLPN